MPADIAPYFTGSKQREQWKQRADEVFLWGGGKRDIVVALKEVIEFIRSTAKGLGYSIDGNGLVSEKLSKKLSYEDVRLLGDKFYEAVVGEIVSVDELLLAPERSEKELALNIRLKKESLGERTVQRVLEAPKEEQKRMIDLSRAAGELATTVMVAIYFDAAGRVMTLRGERARAKDRCERDWHIVDKLKIVWLTVLISIHSFVQVFKGSPYADHDTIEQLRFHSKRFRGVPAKYDDGKDHLSDELIMKNLTRQGAADETGKGSAQPSKVSDAMAKEAQQNTQADRKQQVAQIEKAAPRKKVKAYEKVGDEAAVRDKTAKQQQNAQAGEARRGELLKDKNDSTNTMRDTLQQLEEQNPLSQQGAAAGDSAPLPKVQEAVNMPHNEAENLRTRQ